MAFVAAGVVVKKAEPARSGVCARRAEGGAAKEPTAKKEGLMEWLNKKLMHNWPEDSYGYEMWVKDLENSDEAPKSYVRK